MSYEKTNWINDQTPINADNLNKIENQLETSDTDIADLDSRVGTNETNIGTLNTDLSSLGTSVNAINTRVTETEARLGNIANLNPNFYAQDNNNNYVVDSAVKALNIVPAKLSSDYTAPNVQNNSGIFNLQGFLIEWGVVNVSEVPATSYSITSVSFQSTFSHTPAVFCQPQGNQNVICQVAGLSSTGFKLNARSGDGVKRTDRQYTYIAIGV